MAIYSVRIPNWTEGVPMTFRGIHAESPEQARLKIIEWHNKLAGYHYCDDLPPGTQITKEE